MARPTRQHARGGREDCWSEGATSTLIAAWGDCYLQLNRGNLRQKDWKEVADAVNSSRQNGVVKPPKTDVQCKNRIDTLKKKYKLEKSKPNPATWPFYHRLHTLIGSSPNAAISTKTKPPKTLSFTVKSAVSNPKLLGYRRGGSTESSIGGDNGDGDDDEDENCDRVWKHGGLLSRELARAILKFGEIYERIEKSKPQQMIELERQRMEFTKDLEFQRLNTFMDAQVEIEKIRRPKHAPSSDRKEVIS